MFVVNSPIGILAIQISINVTIKRDSLQLSLRHIVNLVVVNLIHRIGMYDKFGESGPAAVLLKKYKLDGDGVYTQIKEWL